MEKGTIFGLSIVFWVILLGCGLYGIDHSAHLNEYIEGNAYTLDFGLGTTDLDDDGINKIHIHNFCFYYDFTNNKGKISFDLGQNCSLGWVNIRFPSLIENDTFEVYSIKNGTKIDFQVEKNFTKEYYSTTEVNYTYLELDDFTRIFNDEIFVIEFDSNLQPSGTFRFINNNNDHFSGNSEQGNVNFVLGDDYECAGNCVCGLNYIEELPNSSDRNLKFKFNEKNDSSDRWLKISAINRTTRWQKSFSMGVGISLLFASLSSIFVLLYDDGINHNFERLRKSPFDLKSDFHKLIDWIYIKIKNIFHQITNAINTKIHIVLSFIKSTIKRLKE